MLGLTYGQGVADPLFIPSPEIARAVEFAAEHHGDQTRKGTSIPYLQHLLGVASIALEFGATEIETVAAILHDVLEDTSVTENVLRAAFGPEVTDIVLSCSNEAKTGGDPRDSWRSRKEAYVAHLATASASAVLVSLADKIHNARSIGADHRRAEDKETFWERFNAGRDDQVWYYRSLVEMYQERLGAADRRINAAMFDEFDSAVQVIIDSGG